MTAGRVGLWELPRLSRRGFLLAGLSAGTLLATGTGSAWAGASLKVAAAGPAERTVAGPAIVDCAGWGARPNSAVVPIWNRRPVKILVHHTASANVTDYGRPAADRLAHSIQNFHMDDRGWLDTGQHFTISRGGFILEGRHRSLDVLRGGLQQVEGAHCTGQNIVSIGIENEGIYIDVDPPAALWDSLREMCAYICTQYGIAPTELYGHRDFKNTACPGDRLYGMLPRLRREVAAAMGRGIEGGEDRKATWPLLREGDRGPQVQAAQHLLRSAGLPVPADGVFGPATTAALLRFQVGTHAEEPNGMLGGESWPVLAHPVSSGSGADPEAERAVAVLAAARQTESVPDEVTTPIWQRLLGTGGAPANRTTDPTIPPRWPGHASGG